MIREELIPKRDTDTERKIKNIIFEIEDVLEDETKKEFIERKLEEANELIKSKDRILDLYTVEYYYSWTSLDGLVAELTLKVPDKIELSQEEMEELLTHIQENIINAEVVDSSDDEALVDFEFSMNFYHEYFGNNYSLELFDELFDESVDIKLLANKLINFKRSNNVILL